MTLTAHDAPALIGWLEQVLRLRLTARHGDGDRVDHAELVTPDGAGGVMLGSHREGPREVWSELPGAGRAHLVDPDPDAVHARAVAAGAEVVRGSRDTD